MESEITSEEARTLHMLADCYRCVQGGWGSADAPHYCCLRCGNSWSTETGPEEAVDQDCGEEKELVLYDGS